VVAVAMTVLAVLRIGSLNAAAARINDNEPFPVAGNPQVRSDTPTAGR
jgi:hypothetical protein